MASQTRSSVFAVKKETTEGELIYPAAGSEFTVLREGFSFESSVETVDTDELVNAIGASKSFIAKEVPSGSMPHYFKHSGTEGQAPDYGELIEASLGTETVNASEEVTDPGSTAGTASAAATIVVPVGIGANFVEGQGLLIKDSTNGFSIRNVKSISGDVLTLNYNLGTAPASSIGLGKAIHYSPAETSHPTFSAHLYQAAATSSAYHQAIAGCRSTGVTMELPAVGLGEMNFDIEGIEFFFNPVTVVAGTNDIIDFDVTGPVVAAATLEAKTYKTPIEFAREVESKMNGAQSVDTISVSWNSSGANKGKFTISTDGTLLSLDFASGANTAQTAAALLGFDVVDETGSTSYNSDNEATYSPKNNVGAALTPAFDDVDAFTVKANEIFLGDFSRNFCRAGNNVSISLSTPKSDVNDICAVSGVSASVILEREVTFSATLYLEKHEVQDFDEFINNTTSQVMFNGGVKSGGNFVAGKSVNVWIPNMSFTADTVADEDGLVVVNVEGTGFVSASDKDLHINFL